MNIERVISIIDEHGFVVHEYEEKGVLCGYELETWTDGGVNMIHFVDCRETGVTPSAVVEEVKKIAAYFDVDAEIELHREGKDYRAAFTIRESVHDFEEYEERLRFLAAHLQSVLDGKGVLK